MGNSIVIVDDHLLIAKALTSIIEQFDKCQVLYEAENGSVLLEKFKKTSNIPDIVLLDISMPVMNGFETAEWLKSNHPEIKIMALTMQGDETSLIRMIKAGASGYLNKNVHPLELEKALDSLISKGFYYPDWATSSLLNLISNNKEKDEDEIKISERENEFLKYVCTELTYKKIAEKMFCSPRTVESYRDRLFEKLQVKTRVALALYAVKKELYEIK